MIPKIIHFCWLSGDDYPELIKKCMESWKTKLPDYEFVLWDTKKFDINATLWTKQAFDKKKYAFAADYIRLYAVYKYGGIYLDTDVEVLKKFDDFLSLPYFIGNQYDGFPEAAIFGAEKNADWLQECLKYYKNRSFVKEDGSLDTVVLPEIMQSQIKKTKTIALMTPSDIKNISKTIINNNTLYLFPSEYFSPKNFKTNKILKTKNSYTIHHYDSAWLSFMNKKRLKLESLIGVSNAERVIKFLALRKIVKSIKTALHKLNE
ncbi:glycosyltransferase [Flaviramulus aquimarinus]|uniref:Glycosyltransferase n=2 Tax=Flaviramulus aquimarinus TaxID=1170456 RepID=A0ABP9F3J2_9FLAO